MKVHVTLALTQRLDGDFGTQAQIRLLNDLKRSNNAITVISFDAMFLTYFVQFFFVFVK